jgi:hypothetical protein
MLTVIIIIDKTALFCALGFLRRFSQIFLELDLVFASLDFAIILFYRGRKSVLCPTPNLAGQVSVCTRCGNKETGFML